MKTVHKYLEQKQAKFDQHLFFKRLLDDVSLVELAPFAQRLTFWVMSFQDVLRLNAAHISNPDLYKIAQSHQKEDAGHEEWFLNDLKKINGGEPNLRSLYSQEHSPTRYASYVLISEVFKARNDLERIALLLTLESTAQVFFQHIANFSETRGYSHNLEYFSNHHLNAEDNHESLDHNMEAFLDSIEINAEQEKGIFEMIDRAYKAFEEMFNDFQGTLERRVEVLV
jgi:hypothetical protein